MLLRLFLLLLSLLGGFCASWECWGCGWRRGGIRILALDLVAPGAIVLVRFLVWDWQEELLIQVHISPPIALVIVLRVLGLLGRKEGEW